MWASGQSRRWPSLAAALLGLVVTTPAVAQEPSAAPLSDEALAEALFREGRQLTEAGHHAEACGKYAESQRLDPALGTLLNLAECHAEVGRTATAWAELREIVEIAGRQGQEDRRTYARGRVDELEARLSYVRLDGPPLPSDVTLTLDGKRLGAAAIGTRLPLDPGRHLVVTRRGATEEHIRFEVELGPSDQAVSVRYPAAAATASVLTEEPSDARAIAGYVAVALGGVGLGVGSFFGIRAMMLQSDSDERCDGRGCDQEGLDLYNGARRRANIATVCLTFGSVSAAVGAGMLVWAALDPITGSTTVGLTSRF